MHKNDYAIIFTTSKGYMPGTNAILNALEYKVFGGLDVYVMHDTDFITDDYKNAWKSNETWLNVNFELIQPNNVSDTSKSQRWYLLFADVKRSLELFEAGYKVVLIWGSDVLPVNNFIDYFQVTDKLNKVVLGTNEHGTHTLRMLDMKWPYRHHWRVPYADVPFFVPVKQRGLLQKMLYYQSLSDCELSHMDGMNYAVKELGTPIFEVPGELWVQNVPHARLLYFDWKTASVYLKNSSTKLNAIHRKYWNEHIVETYLTVKDDMANNIGLANKRNFAKLYTFFNEKCRVKLNDYFEF